VKIFIFDLERSPDRGAWIAKDGDRIVTTSYDPLHTIAEAMIGGGCATPQDVLFASIGGEVVAVETVIDAARREKNTDVFARYWSAH